MRDREKKETKEKKEKKTKNFFYIQVGYVKKCTGLG